MTGIPDRTGIPAEPTGARIGKDENTMGTVPLSWDCPHLYPQRKGECPHFHHSFTKILLNCRHPDGQIILIIHIGGVFGCSVVKKHCVLF